MPQLLAPKKPYGLPQVALPITRTSTPMPRRLLMMASLAEQVLALVSTNTRAVSLWERFGFRIIGTVPEGFRHPAVGFVDLYIMYRELS